MKIKSLILFSTVLLYAAATMGQTQTLSGFKSISSRAISPIFDGKEVKGYALIYKTDKADKENDNIHIAVYDVNLAPTKTIDLKKPRGKYLMLGNAYNGEGVGFYFYNFKEKQFEIEMYDKNLVKQAEVTDNHKLSDMEEMAINTAKASADKDQAGFGATLNIYPVAGQGFITNGALKHGKGYTLKMYDNKLKEKWSYSSPEDAEGYESMMISEVNGRYLIGNVIKRPSLFSTKMTFYLTVFDALTGKKKMEIPISGDSKDQLSLNTIVYEESTDQIIAIGDYYAEGDKVGSARSKGFYFKVYSSDGKEGAKQMYSWEKDVKTKLPAEANESLEKGAMNYTHKILKGEDGKYYLVAEQYSKAASGMGIANRAMGGSSNVTKAILWNLMVIVLNKDLTLSEIKYFTKDKSDADVPPGLDFYGPGIWGMMMKQWGSFDYQFTQTANDGKSYDIVYVNYDKEKGEDTKRVLGNIIISPDGKFNLDKIDITSKATASFLYPSKPGFLMMVDYLKKEQSLGMKLVKLNY